MRDDVWLEPLRRELDSVAAPRTFSIRDDDAGWANDRLVALLDVFARYSVPLDLAVIPAALEPGLAASLRRRPEAVSGLLAFHQHGFEHVNHERGGRPCEFGPGRAADDQRRDIESGARRLAKRLGETAPIFTPPWNRCTETTGRCLLELGFRGLARDSSADALELEGLQELRVQIDWSRPRGPRGELLAAVTREDRTVGVMLHHADLGPDDRENIEQLLALVTSHQNACCVSLGSLLTA